MCLAQVEERIDNIRKAIKIAQEAANEETKSSAGDKYETGRAMMQIEIDQQMRQMAEAEKLKTALGQAHPQEHHDKVAPGSLVKTSVGTFYLSISLGKLVLDNTEYLAVSPSSPVGQQMLKKTKGDMLWFNGKEIEIIDVI